MNGRWSEGGLSMKGAGEPLCGRACGPCPLGSPRAGAVMCGVSADVWRVAVAPVASVALTLESSCGMGTALAAERDCVRRRAWNSCGMFTLGPLHWPAAHTCDLVPRPSPARCTPPGHGVRHGLRTGLHSHVALSSSSPRVPPAAVPQVLPLLHDLGCPRCQAWSCLVPLPKPPRHHHHSNSRSTNNNPTAGRSRTQPRNHCTLSAAGACRVHWTQHHASMVTAASHPTAVRKGPAAALAAAAGAAAAVAALATE